MGLFHGLYLVPNFFAETADFNPRLFGFLLEQLNEFLAPFFGQRRYVETYNLSVNNRVQPQVAFAYRAVNSGHYALIPWLYNKRARFRSINGCKFLYGHFLTIGIQGNIFNKRWRCPPGSNI